jgi:hypothetical protein
MDRSMKALIAAAAFAVAAPGADLGPVLAGDGVVWSTFGGRVVHAAGGVPETIFTARRDEIVWLQGSRGRVAAFWDRTRGARFCYVGGPCSPPRGELVGGFPMRRKLGAIERRGRCRASLEDPTEMGLSGDRLIYEERLWCGRRTRLRLVVRNLRTGNRRVVHRGNTERPQLAGRFAAFFAGRRLVVVDARTRRVAAVARGIRSYRTWYSLDADGTVALVTFRGLRFHGRLDWFSPREPRLHRLPARPSIFSSEPLIVAGGRIVFVRDRGRELAVTDLAGNERAIARFDFPEVLDEFAFDGVQVAWRSSRYRPYAGAADNGLPYMCPDGTPHVLATAPVIEVHPLDAAVRLPPPSEPAPRNQPRERPDCDED